MRILHHGKEITTDIIFQLKCQKCGCEWECNASEFDVSTRAKIQSPKWVVTVSCPDCKNRTEVGNITPHREETNEIDYSNNIFFNLNPVLALPKPNFWRRKKSRRGNQ